MQTMKTIQEYGGMNIILERKQDQKLYKCKQCEFRANCRVYLSQHKRMEHTDYMLLCDRCGYISNQLGNLKRHVRAKHP